MNIELIIEELEKKGVDAAVIAAVKEMNDRLRVLDGKESLVHLTLTMDQARAFWRFEEEQEKRSGDQEPLPGPPLKEGRGTGQDKTDKHE